MNLSGTWLQQAFFDAADELERYRCEMKPEEIAAVEEWIHQLGVKAFPEIAAAYRDISEVQ